VLAAAAAHEEAAAAAERAQEEATLAAVADAEIAPTAAVEPRACMTPGVPVAAPTDLIVVNGQLVPADQAAAPAVLRSAAPVQPATPPPAAAVVPAVFSAAVATPVAAAPPVAAPPPVDAPVSATKSAPAGGVVVTKGSLNSAVAENELADQETEPVAPICSAGHSMLFCEHTGGIYKHGWFCDGCTVVKGPRKGPRWFCLPCRQDFCEKCAKKYLPTPDWKRPANAAGLTSAGPSAADLGLGPSAAGDGLGAPGAADAAEGTSEGALEPATDAAIGGVGGDGGEGAAATDGPGASGAANTDDANAGKAEEDAEVEEDEGEHEPPVDIAQQRKERRAFERARSDINIRRVSTDRIVHEGFLSSPNTTCIPNKSGREKRDFEWLFFPLLSLSLPHTHARTRAAFQASALLNRSLAASPGQEEQPLPEDENGDLKLKSKTKIGLQAAALKLEAAALLAELNRAISPS